MVQWVIAWSALSALWKEQDNLDPFLALGITKRALTLYTKI